MNDPNSALKGQEVLIVKVCGKRCLCVWFLGALDLGAFGLTLLLSIFQTAWGGKTLAGDYRPPSSSGETMWCSGSCPRGVGHYYTTSNYTKPIRIRCYSMLAIPYERSWELSWPCIFSTRFGGFTVVADVAKILAPGVIGKMYCEFQ